MMHVFFFQEARMSISMHSLSADRVASPSAVHWYLIVGAVLLALAIGPVLRGDPGASKGTTVGMIVP